MSRTNHCGIDFGTTNSSLAISSNIIPIDRHNSNQNIFKSILYVNPDHQFSFGSEAIKKYLYDLDTIPPKAPYLYETGRMIKTFGPSTGSGAGPPIWVPEVVELDNSGRGRLIQSLKSVLTSETFQGTTIFQKFFPLEDLLSQLLHQIKTNAENIVGHSLNSVVLGRPVRYVGTGSDKIALSRMSTIAKSAGFKNIEFEYEPVGAALNYGLNLTDNQTILVYDFGGGTLDVCIMKFPDSKVISVAGRGIGGDLVNTRLLQSKISPHFGTTVLPRFFLNEISTWYRSTLLKTVKNIETLRYLKINSSAPQLVNNLIELIVNDYGYNLFTNLDISKIALSQDLQTIFSFIKPTISISEPITRLDLEESIGDEIQGSKDCILEALKLADLKPENIDKVILTGGSSQIPVFKNQIKSIFDPSKIIISDHFTAVASGLSLRAKQIFA